MAGLGLFATAAQLAIAEPPLKWPESPEWLWAAPNPWVLVTALFSAIGAVSAVYTFFQPKPYTAAQGKEDRDHTNQEFAKADRRQDERQEKTHAELAEIKRQLAELTVQIQQENPQQAQGFAKATQGLVESGDAADLAIASTIVGESPESAADGLMAEVALGKRRSAERARQAARIYAPFAPSKAKAAYEQAVELDPADVWSWIELGRLSARYDSIASARSCYAEAQKHVTQDRDRWIIRIELADLLFEEGGPDAAAEYKDVYRTMECAAHAAPEDWELQRDFLILSTKVGQAEMKNGDRVAANRHYQRGLEIVERLAASKRPDTEIMHYKSVILWLLGDLALIENKYDDARKRLTESLEILAELTVAEPKNRNWRQNRLKTVARLGDTEASDGQFELARRHYSDGLVIATELAGDEPNDADLQRDLFVHHFKLGEIEESLQHDQAARTCFKQAEGVALRLAERWPENSRFARDLAAVRKKLG